MSTGAGVDTSYASAWNLADRENTIVVATLGTVCLVAVIRLVSRRRASV